MIFGVAKAISREHTAMEDHDVLIVDLQDVPILGVTASLALENAIQEACEHQRPVFVVGATGQTRQRLEKLGLARFVPSDRMVDSRVEALQGALDWLEGPEASTSPSPYSNSLSAGV
jgi:SulP family sulfate permease